MAWWSSLFKKRDEAARRAERDFRDMLAQALLRQDDLVEATERLKESRKPMKRGNEDPDPDDPVQSRGTPRLRNV